MVTFLCICLSRHFHQICGKNTWKRNCWTKSYTELKFRDVFFRLSSRKVVTIHQFILFALCPFTTLFNLRMNKKLLLKLSLFLFCFVFCWTAYLCPLPIFFFLFHLLFLNIEFTWNSFLSGVCGTSNFFPLEIGDGYSQ